MHLPVVGSTRWLTTARAVRRSVEGRCRPDRRPDVRGRIAGRCRIPCRAPSFRPVPVTGKYYVLSRYPVLKIHHTVARHVARKRIVMLRLTPMLTSAIP